MVNEEEFYKYFCIGPILLSKCQYYNQFHLGIVSGDDVCEHVDEDQHDCKDCSKSRLVETWYPEITDDVIARLLWICPVTHNMSFENIDNWEKFKNDVFEYVKKYFEDDDYVTPKFTYIQEILKAHMQEMSTW